MLKLLLLSALEHSLRPCHSPALFICSSLHRCKEEARRACRAGKKQLVGSLSCSLGMASPAARDRGSEVQRTAWLGFREQHLQVAQAPQLTLYREGLECSCGCGLNRAALLLLCGLPCPTPIYFHSHQALRSLKAKQRTEKRIEALHAKLDTVQGILDRIYASQTDQMVATPLRALWSQSPTLQLPPL